MRVFIKNLCALGWFEKSEILKEPLFIDTGLTIEVTDIFAKFF